MTEKLTSYPINWFYKSSLFEIRFLSKFVLVQQLNKQQDLVALAIVINSVHIPHLKYFDGTRVLDYI